VSELSDYLRESYERLTENPDWNSHGVQHPYIAAKKISAIIPVSQEMLMDVGAIPDSRPKIEHPKHPKPTWRPRFYCWRSRQKERLTYWLFEKLMGYPVPDPDDYR